LLELFSVGRHLPNFGIGYRDTVDFSDDETDLGSLDSKKRLAVNPFSAVLFQYIFVAILGIGFTSLGILMCIKFLGRTKIAGIAAFLVGLGMLMHVVKGVVGLFEVCYSW
jgi:hypothetical protein